MQVVFLRPVCTLSCGLTTAARRVANDITPAIVCTLLSFAVVDIMADGFPDIQKYCLGRGGSNGVSTALLLLIWAG